MIVEKGNANFFSKLANVKCYILTLFARLLTLLRRKLATEIIRSAIWPRLICNNYWQVYKAAYLLLTNAGINQVETFLNFLANGWWRGNVIACNARFFFQCFFPSLSLYPIFDGHVQFYICNLFNAFELKNVNERTFGVEASFVGGVMDGDDLTFGARVLHKFNT